MVTSTAEATAGGADAGTPDGHGAGRKLRLLIMGAIGVVYGDIGTSPLYAMRESFGEAGGLDPDEASVLGVLSLIFWALALIVTLKYVILILRADNRGEGGVLALSTLALRAAHSKRYRALVLTLAMAGMGLFYGDGLITPAISVLSAVEGLSIATPAFDRIVLPITMTVLVGLFLIQRHGTALVGRLFGPIMCLWFTVLAVMGLMHIVQMPEILRAVDPRYAMALFQAQHWQAFVALGAIVLAVTGAEALYADMGHFGRPAIRIAWFGMVWPALLLNYFGQGVLILTEPDSVEHPFFRMAPSWAIYPLVALATMATIIASQAVISGVFSLTRQAVQLGYLPRMTIRHTSATEVGQIYVPRVNWALMLGVLLLVLMFRTSGGLAAAYGIAVTGAMAASAVLAGFVAVKVWGWSRLVAVVVFGMLLLIDLVFVAANSLKILEGGWFPLVVALLVFALITTWRRGRRVLFDRIYNDTLPVETFLATLGPSVTRVAGTAIFMTGSLASVPHALLHNLKHNKVLHERVVLMTVETEDVPQIADDRRLEVERLGKGLYTIRAHYGYMEEPNVPKVLELGRRYGFAFDMMQSSFFLGRETLIPSISPELEPWEERVFIAMSGTALSATAYFGIPPGRVVELGTQIEI